MKSLQFIVSLLFVVFACTSAPPVYSDKSSGVLVKDKHQFLKLLFEQSTDQAFQSSKWSEACLKENIVGDIEENGKAIWFKSVLWLNEKLLPGFCPGQPNVHKTGIVYFYCKGNGKHSQVKCALNECSDFTWEQECLN